MLLLVKSFMIINNIAFGNSLIIIVTDVFILISYNGTATAFIVHSPSGMTKPGETFVFF